MNWGCDILQWFLFKKLPSAKRYSEVWHKILQVAHATVRVGFSLTFHPKVSEGGESARVTIRAESASTFSPFLFTRSEERRCLPSVSLPARMREHWLREMGRRCRVAGQCQCGMPRWFVFMQFFFAAHVGYPPLHMHQCRKILGKEYLPLWHYGN